MVRYQHFSPEHWYVKDWCSRYYAHDSSTNGYGFWSKGINRSHPAYALYGRHYSRGIADWKVVAKLLPTAILGFFLAIGVDNMIPNGQFRQLMGWTLMLALVVMIWSEIFGKENRWMKKWWYAAIFGLLGGFTTMIGNAAGPVMSVYLLSMRKEKMEYIGINAWFFLVVNLLKVPLQAFVWDNITWDSLQLNLVMLPVIGIGSLIGIRIVKLLPEKIFRRFIQIVTILSVILMII